MSGCCRKPKNPCMVCMRTVTNKTGLQCQGSCKAWIHYACCSYTPGKIKDIKAKIIKVRCPCPDCTPQVPKEEIVKEDSFSCVNLKCPVNQLPKCGYQECPVNKISQMPSSCQSPPCAPKEWPGVPCGAACKKNSTSSKTNVRHGSNMGDRKASPPPCIPSPCLPPPCIPPPCGPLPCQPAPCRQPPPCSPPPSCPQATPRCPPPPCPPPPCPGAPQRGPVMPSISVVENMCETVGLLSDQLNQLMCKMTNVLNPKQGGGSGSPGNPCYCPQNPKRN